MTEPVSRRWSLARRMLVFSLVGLVPMALLLGVLLRESLHDTLRGSIERSLAAAADDLIADVRLPAGDALLLPRYGHDFDRIFSGWYWQVSLDQRDWRSRSLWDDQIRDLRVESGTWLHATGPLQQPLLGTERTRQTEAGLVRLQVFTSLGPMHADLARIDRLLLVALAVVVLALLALALVQVRLVLAPLRELNTDLWRLHDGHQSRVQARYGPDLQPVADTLNAVLQSNAAVVERSRHQAEDLGHAIKAPLSVMALALTSPDPDLEGLRDKLHDVTRLINRSLARVASSAGSIESVPVADVATRVLALMRQLHASRGLSWTPAVADGAVWRGSISDMEEVLGNLLDNAGKWATGQVRLSLSVAEGVLRLCVDDDGPGLSPDMREAVLQRGRRLDEQKPGQGLGLSITRTLADSYGGDLQLEDSALGGLRVCVQLPGMKL